MRESSGSTAIESTLLKALKVLKLFNIPPYVCGGFAVQEHGYPRFTVDVDISDKPQILTLASLISSKLSTYIGRGVQRAQDYAEVVKLIQVNELNRDCAVDPKVRGYIRSFGMNFTNCGKQA